MIRRIDLRGQTARHERVDYRALVPRADLDVDAALEQVRSTLEAIRAHGHPAVLECARRDDPSLSDVRVPASAAADALAALDPGVRSGLEESIRRLRLVSEKELETETRVEIEPGAVVSQRYVPYNRVGVYVPGGIAPLPSSVIMTVVPAQVAGVRGIALASPAQPEFSGRPHPTILAVCALLGVSEVYAVGGVGAVGMFAYGTAECPRTDFIAGPGRITTAAAKRLVKGIVGIDSEAGPTEIAILADDSADPDFVAADLVSQAEHDPMAASVLVTPSVGVADAVTAALATQVPAAKHSERIAEALAGEQSGIVLVDDLEQGLAVVDAYAAEHLEIHTRDAERLAEQVTNAGAIFIGPWAPVSLGDYCAGSNHVLPTGGCACHSSGLSVRSYLKAVHVVRYDRRALTAVAPHVIALAGAEDLPAHGTAVSVRLDKERVE